MRILQNILWLFAGSLLAFLFLYSQSWSTRIIHPGRVKLSKWIVIGGAVIRWIVVFVTFMLALSISIIALLITFCSFMSTRLIILFIWNKRVFNNKKNTTWK